MSLIEKTLKQIEQLEERVLVTKKKGKVNINVDSSDENNVTYESSNISYMNFSNNESHPNLTKVEVVVNDDVESEKIEENDWNDVFGKTKILIGGKKE